MQIYRKRYELLQLVVISRDAITPEIQLQYRKRYELLQPFRNHVSDISKYRYNTASGMSCCNISKMPEMRRPPSVTIPQAVWAVATENKILRAVSSDTFKLQYRKRYELLQLDKIFLLKKLHWSYNTASGMSFCNEYVNVIEKSRGNNPVTIPQAVWAVAT